MGDRALIGKMGPSRGTGPLLADRPDSGTRFPFAAHSWRLDAFSGIESRCGDHGVVAAFAGVTGFLALIQVACLGTGAAGVTLDRPLAVTILALGLVLAGVFGFRFRGMPGKPIPARGEPRGGADPKTRSRSLDRPPGQPWHSRPDDTSSTSPTGTPVPANSSIAIDGFCRAATLAARTLALAAIAWGLWVYGNLWVLAAQRPVMDWDGLYYHIPAIHGWTLAGRVTWLDLPDLPFANGYPMGVEVFTFLMHAVLRDSGLVDACNLWYWPLACLALVVIASQLGARGIWRWLAGALIFGAPVFVSQSVTCYIDPAFACTVMGAVAAAQLLVFRDDIATRWRVLLFGLSLGLLSGSKGIGAPFALIIILVTAAGLIYRHGLTSWRCWSKRLAAAVLAMLAVSGYWYIRNTIKTGNPIHPIQVTLGEKVIAEGYDPMQMLDENLPSWLEKVPGPLRMFAAWLEPDAPISGYAPTSGLGRIWLTGGLPAAIYLWILLWRRPASRRKASLGFLTILVLALLVGQPARWWGRLTVWLHVLGLPCLGAVLALSFANLKRSRWHLIPVILAMVVIGTAAGESRTTLALESQAGRNLRPEPTDSFQTGSGSPGTRTTSADPLVKRTSARKYLTTLECMFPGLEQAPDAGQFLAARRIARSPWSRTGTLLGGTLCLPLGWRTLTVLPASPGGEDVTRLRQCGTQWIVWDVLGAGEVPAILEEQAVEEFRFQPAADADFCFLKLHS